MGKVSTFLTRKSHLVVYGKTEIFLETIKVKLLGLKETKYLQ